MSGNARRPSMHSPVPKRNNDKPLRQALIVGGIVGTAMLALAFVAAPHSCAWGLDVYVGSGVACVALMFVVPLALCTDRDPFKRLILGAAFSAACVAIWIVGFFAADMRLVCRLF